MLPIERPEAVITIVTRFGYIYNLRPGTLVVQGDNVTYEAKARGSKDWNRTTIHRDDIGTITEAVQ
jgi:hypothetical protein